MVSQRCLSASYRIHRNSSRERGKVWGKPLLHSAHIMHDSDDNDNDRSVDIRGDANEGH